MKRSQFLQLFFPFGFYLLGCFGAYVLAPESGDWRIPLFYTNGIIASILAWKLGAWSSRISRFISFGALLLLVLAANHVLYLFDFLVNGSQANLWPFYSTTRERSLLIGEMMTVLGTFITVFVWRRFGGLKSTPEDLLRCDGDQLKLLFVVFSFSSLAMLVALFFPRVSSALGQFIPSALGAGLACCYLIPAASLRSGSLRLLVAIIMSLPFIAISLGEGMKENIIVALLPVGIAAWQCFRTVAMRAILIIAAVVVLGSVTSYVNFYRDNYWRTNEKVATIDAISAFVDSGKMSTDVGSKSGVELFLERANASWYHGWAVSVADEWQYYPDLALSPMLSVFVPRVFWPDKPRYIQGAEYTALVNGQMTVHEGGSSTAVGFYPGLYLGGGFAAFLLGAVGVGALLAFAARFVWYIGSRTSAVLYVFAMLPFIVRMSEAWPVDGLVLPIASAFYVLLMVFVARAFFFVMPRFTRSDRD